MCCFICICLLCALFELLLYLKLNWFAVKCCMACIITISYQLAAHLSIYYFCNLQVSLAMNSIHLWVVCGSVSPSFFFFLPESDLGSPPLLSVVFFPIPVFSMEDCSCGCLAKRAADGCVYESGLELSETQRRGQPSCLLYNNHGFRAPYVYRLTVGDLKESWLCVSFRFVFFFLLVSFWIPWTEFVV